MTKKAWAQILSGPGKDERKVVATLTGVSYLVEEEKAGFVQVRHRGVAGWLPKDDAVLFDDAVPFFTSQISKDSNDAHAYGCRAMAWKEKGQFDRALEDCNEAIRLVVRQSSIDG
jgi:hypothetical protein